MGKSSLIVGIVLLLLGAWFAGLTIASANAVGAVIVGGFMFAAGWALSIAYRRCA